MQEVRRLRHERGWNQTELAFRSRLAPSVISQIENGKRDPSAGTLKKLAKALEVEVADLFPKAQDPLPLEESVSPERSLVELHVQAACKTDWLIMPEEKWHAAWHRSVSPKKALQILRESAAEFFALRPLMAEQERGLPWSKRALSGPYKQAWSRLFAGYEAAHACGEFNGLIDSAETPNDLAKKLGEETLEGLPFVS